jgi:hypothetical protein
MGQPRRALVDHRGDCGDLRMRRRGRMNERPQDIYEQDLQQLKLGIPKTSHGFIHAFSLVTMR